MSIASVFKAYDIRATHPDPLNEEVAWKVGFAAAAYFKEQLKPGLEPTLVVSRDHRPMAPAMASSLIAGIRAGGLNVVDLGLADTSIQYFAIPHLRAVGGIQCTASHNPIQYTGFKISGPGAVPVGKETGLGAIREKAEKLSGACPAPVGTLATADVWAAYRSHILAFMGELPRPMRLFVDCSNGCGIELVKRVFTGVKNLSVTAINDSYALPWAHEPNPLVPANMLPTRNGVKQGDYDLGACFDGDADRCMLADDLGDTVGCDHLTAALAAHFLAQKPGAGVAYDLRSSKAVPEAVQAAGGVPHMTKVGHVNIKQALRETGSVFGGELSGHFYFQGNSNADSGAITLAVALGVVARSGKKLSQLIQPHRKYPQSGEINFKCEDKAGAIAKAKADFGAGAKVFELDGVSVDAWDAKGFWFNLRASNTEPLLRLNAEAKDAATLANLLAKLKPALGEEDHGH